MKIRAFKVNCLDTDSIVFAGSASKARYAVFHSANDVGYGVEFKEISVKRVPELDKSKTIYGHYPEEGKCYLSEHICNE